MCTCSSCWGEETLRVVRGDIFFADLSPVVGSEQGGVRPVLVIQNDVGNKFSPTVIVAAITSRITKSQLPIHVELTVEDHNLDRDSVVLLEQIRTIDKRRLKEKVAHVGPETMKRIDRALMISLGLTEV
ncbi:MAG: type II toxin-antitoxin system PemK/MazF family toxin [Bacillota bacterium]